MSTQTLRMEYENIKLRDAESIEDFALRFSAILQRLGDLGDAERDENAVRKYLRVIQGRYKHRVVSWRLSLISPRCPLRRSPAH